MKKLSLMIAALAIAVFSAFNVVNEPLAIGKKAPMQDVKMLNYTGVKLSLDDIKKENGLLVIYSCNTCPFVIAWEDRYPALGEFCAANNIGMVLVNSNVAKRDGDDSVEAMTQHAIEKGYNTAYVVDENAALADAMGARTTPHVFLFNKDMELAYRGAIDDNHKSANDVTTPYLNKAIESLAKGETIRTAETKALGCSIKRIKK
jgi:hypothetical protein